MTHAGVVLHEINPCISVYFCGPIFVISPIGVNGGVTYGVLCTKTRQKIAFKLSLISTRAELPITSSAGISVQPEAAHLTPGNTTILP